MNQGDLSGTETEFMLPARNRRAVRAGVRASVGAMKSRNGDGAKGTQGGGDVTDGQTEERPARVSATTTQAGEIRDRWSWVEPSVWSAGLLTLSRAIGRPLGAWTNGTECDCEVFFASDKEAGDGDAIINTGRMLFLQNRGCSLL